MRVAIIAESFLPHMNGVTGSVLHILRHLERSAHEAIVIAPGSIGVPDRVHGAAVITVPSVPLPSYPQVRVAATSVGRIERDLAAFDPDVVHLASPFVLGAQAVAAAERLRIPTVAVYQTDVAGYTERYGVPAASRIAQQRITRLHRRATLTLVPSTSAREQLTAFGVDRLRTWGRGVDTAQFHPGQRDHAWRSRVAPGRTIVGFVGRLASEKQVEHLVAVADLPGVQLVIIGDGPARKDLERVLPDALFLGYQSGDTLARSVASFDVFVHPGESETFGQTIQEALASGVPVVATGRGGPRDLVRSSIDGWLYRPGDLAELRERVRDLAGDGAKRHAFGLAAHEAMRDRTWPALCAQLLTHYDEAARLHSFDERDTRRRRPQRRPERVPPPPVARAWRRYVALGDSITEGLCDGSRMPTGQYRGWADRLAQLLALSTPGEGEFRYANLAVRSRRVVDLVREQVPHALALRPDLVSILMGANDLVSHREPVDDLANAIEGAVRMLRSRGCDVLLATPFLPDRRARVLFRARFDDFAIALRRIAVDTGAILLDLHAMPELGELPLWADDKVHLRSRGHRLVAYRAADALGIAHADALAGLDEAFHADDDALPLGGWVRRDVLPWALRRVRGRTAGDGLAAKHSDYIVIPRPHRRGSGVDTAV